MDKKKEEKSTKEGQGKFESGEVKDNPRENETEPKNKPGNKDDKEKKQKDDDSCCGK